MPVDGLLLSKDKRDWVQIAIVGFVVLLALAPFWWPGNFWL